MKPLFNLLRRPLFVIAVFSFFINLLLLAPALFMLQVFDRVLSSQSSATLLVLLVGMTVALSLMLLLDYARSRLQGVAGNMVGEQLSPAIARLMLRQSAQRAENQNVEGLRDVSALRNLFSAQGLLALFDAPWAIIYVAVIWLAHPVLGMTAAAACFLMLLLAVVNDTITRSGIEALQKEAAQATRYLESSMQNAEVVQAMGMGNTLIAKWREHNAKVTELQRPTAHKSVAMAAVIRTVRQAVQVTMQALGAYLVISGEGTAGILVATTILLGRALAPVEQIVGSWRTLAEGRLAYRRLSQSLSSEDSKPEPMPLPAPVGRLLAQDLLYRAPGGDRILLAGVSLSLEPGQSLAILGASGAGKSTLLRLLTGLWKPSAGVVRLDHADLAQWPREELGQWLGYVPQDVELFPGTVAENIARLRTPDPLLVAKAAMRAGVHEMILSLPAGYDTPLGTGMLSPGQRQRIALARALYGDPKLLILDEPNSNLDGAGEVALGEALKALKGEVTVVVVTHRTALVQHVDKMLVLDAGRVQHYGKVADVMKAMRQSQGAEAIVAMRPVPMQANSQQAAPAPNASVQEEKML